MITSNIEQIIKELGDFEKTQLPSATQVSLNNTAEIAMQIMKKKIDKDFDVNGKWNKVGGKAGIKKRAADKKRIEDGVEIFIPEENWWLEDHEYGATRNNQLIPTRGFKALFPKITQHKAIKKQAKELLSNKKKYRIFEAPLTSGSTTRAIFQRVKGTSYLPRKKSYLKKNKKGKIYKSRAGKVLLRNAVPLFIYKSTVKENEILDFKETILGVFQKEIDTEFSKALKYAMSKAKR